MGFAFALACWACAGPYDAACAAVCRPPDGACLGQDPSACTEQCIASVERASTNCAQCVATHTTWLAACAVDAGGHDAVCPQLVCEGFHIPKKSGSLCGAPCGMP